MRALRNCSRLRRTRLHLQLRVHLLRELRVRHGPRLPELWRRAGRAAQTPDRRNAASVKPKTDCPAPIPRRCATLQGPAYPGRLGARDGAGLAVTRSCPAHGTACTWCSQRFASCDGLFTPPSGSRVAARGRGTRAESRRVAPPCPPSPYRSSRWRPSNRPRRR